MRAHSPSGWPELAILRRGLGRSAGTQANGSSSAPAISPDGGIVVFVSSAPNLVSGDTNGFADIFRKDRLTGEIRMADLTSGGGLPDAASSAPTASNGGTAVYFLSPATNLVSGDTNHFTDVFRRSPFL